MTPKILLLPILLPLCAGIITFIIFKRFRAAGVTVSLLATLLNLLVSIIIFKHNITFSLPWAGFGFEFLLRLYHFSAFILLAIAGFGFLVTLYSCVSMRGKPCENQFFACLLLTLSFANGAVLADNLVLMLFFWEGLLLPLFGMIAIGGKAAYKTATKAFVIAGIADLFMMIGIGLAGHLAGTLTISGIHLSPGGLGGLAFILLMCGAISKAGSMPFHSWIPDAAVDAPLPFMALVPAALEKLLGIYFLARISLDMFNLAPDSWVCMMLMIMGSITILLAVMMALIQKDYTRLLSYHAISQVGYMVLGIGTGVPAGIVGGLFHMINNAMYKSCLFLTGGAVAKQTGTTNLGKLGGLGAKMPFTFICFIITAASISGVPPFNGFFSKELIYDGALERGLIFYIAAVSGSFFTAASFLKLGHSAFSGPLNEKHKNVKEAPLLMLVPMGALAFLCILFGVWNPLPLRALIQPIAGDILNGRDFSGLPSNIFLVLISLGALGSAFLNHLYGVKKNGSALKAVDHIHHAPILSGIYDRAEKKYFDPYEVGLKIINVVSIMCWWVDMQVDGIYNKSVVGLTYSLTRRIRRFQNGNYVRYLIWSLIGMFLVTLFLMYSR
jgi:NADH-quinone oxidoreductase subunit L